MWIKFAFGEEGWLWLTICFLKWWWGEGEFPRDHKQLLNSLEQNLWNQTQWLFSSWKSCAQMMLLPCWDPRYLEEQVLAAADFGCMDQRSINGQMLVPARSPPRHRYNHFIIYYMRHDKFIIYSQLPPLLSMGLLDFFFGIAEIISVKCRARSIRVWHKEMKHFLGSCSLAAHTPLLAVVWVIFCLCPPVGLAGHLPW